LKDDAMMTTEEFNDKPTGSASELATKAAAAFDDNLDAAWSDRVAMLTEALAKERAEVARLTLALDALNGAMGETVAKFDAERAGALAEGALVTYWMDRYANRADAHDADVARLTAERDALITARDMLGKFWADEKFRADMLTAERDAAMEEAVKGMEG
jgi:hypothetical protein